MSLYKQTAPHRGRDQNYNLNHTLPLGITQCAIGLLCLILDLVGLGLLVDQHFFAGSGIWSGIIFFITGVLGIIASKVKTAVTIISFLEFSFASALLAIVLLILKSLCIASNYRSYLRSDNVNVVLSIVLLLLALTECTLAAISNVLCTKAIYRARSDMSKNGDPWQTSLAITKSTEAGTDKSMDPHSQPAAPPGDWRQIRLKFLIPGIMQCVIGVICFVEDLVLRLRIHRGYAVIPVASTTVWCGFFFIVGGVIGIIASLRRSKCSIALFLVTSVTCALSAIVLCVIKSVNVSSRIERRVRFDAMDISLVALAAVEFIVAVISASICGLALRKKKGNDCVSHTTTISGPSSGLHLKCRDFDNSEQGARLSDNPHRIMHAHADKRILLLTVPQCVIGVACIIMGPVRLSFGYYNNQRNFMASEFWCGIPFLVAGVSGVIASMRKRKCTLSVFLVTSFLAALCGVTLIAMKIVVAATNKLRDRTNLALDVSLMLAGLTQLVLSCISVAASCRELIKRHTKIGTHTAPNAITENDCDEIPAAPSCVFYKNFARGYALNLSILQVVAGIVCIVCDIYGIILLDYQKIFVASGIWCGVIFFAAGVIGIVASKRTLKCTIIAFLVFAVLASLCAVVLLCIKSVSAHKIITYRGHSDHQTLAYIKQGRILAMNVALIVVALGEGAASVSSVFICGAGLYKINSRKTPSPKAGESAHDHLATESGNKANDHAPALPSGELHNYSVNTFAGLGAALCVLGLLCIIVDLVGIALPDRHNRYPSYASGIWCGIIFVITGVFGVIASKKKCVATVAAFMVTSLTATLFAVILFVLKCINASGYANERWNKYQNGQLTMRIVSIVLALATGAVTIASTVICCVAIYRSNKRMSGAADSNDVTISSNACARGSGKVSLSSARRTDGKGRDVPKEHTDGYNCISRTVLILGISQCVIGILCFIVDLIGIGIRYFTTFFVSSGIWSGVMFGAAGTLAIFSAKMKTRCTMTSSLVASCVTMVFAVALIAVKITSAVLNARQRVYIYVALAVGLLVLAVAELIIAALTAYLSLVGLREKKAGTNQTFLTCNDQLPLQEKGTDLSETDQKMIPDIVSNIPSHGSTDQTSIDADNMADSDSKNSAQNDGKTAQRGHDGDQMITHM